MNEDELIGLLRERQNNGRTAYLTFGELVAMVPSDQVDGWRYKRFCRCSVAP